MTTRADNRTEAAAEAATKKQTSSITQEQADAIGRILAEEYESNEAFREVVNARAARLAKGEAA